MGRTAGKSDVVMIQLEQVDLLKGDSIQQPEIVVGINFYTPCLYCEGV